jgi:hypothetical protein
MSDALYYTICDVFGYIIACITSYYITIYLYDKYYTENDYESREMYIIYYLKN